MNRFLVAMLGARMHYAVPRILERANGLECFFTDLYASKGWPRLLNAIPMRLRPHGIQKILSRKAEELSSNRIVAFNGLGLEYAKLRRAVRTPTELTKVFLEFNKKFCERVIKSNWHSSSAVYTFNCAGLEILERAKQRGLLAVTEQTIAPYKIEQELLASERSQHLDWEEDVEDAFAQKYIDREMAEWVLADIIVCGSEFVRDSILKCGGPAEKCMIVPYGVDIAGTRHLKPTTLLRPIRVLTVGAVSLRKGAPYVLGAAKELGSRAEFRWVGGVNVMSAKEKTLREYIELVGTVPRTEINCHYQWADVFLLPSVCEGSATATYEALSHGLPVICSPNTGSVVRDGVEGFVVPTGDFQRIAEYIELLRQNTGLRRRLSEAALQAASNFTLPKYGKKLLDAISGN